MSETESSLSSSLLTAFLAPDLDRASFIAAWLRANGVPSREVSLAGKRHLVVRFPGEDYDPRFRMKTLVAHYDRAPGTSGANDNSAACFQLMAFAKRLSDRAWLAERGITTHNVRIFFTDGEEAAGTKGIAGQGAYALGEGFRKLKMTGDDLFVLDACGRGDTLILSTAEVNRKGPVGDRLRDLHERSAELARESAPGAWLSLDTPYSDNAGFIAAGIASQVITVLPRVEAEKLLRAQTEANADEKRRQALHALIVANRTRSRSPRNADEALCDAIPETWRLMHTALDDAASLTAAAFRLMENLLAALAARRDIAV
jgi:hypothetical protein